MSSGYGDYKYQTNIEQAKVIYNEGSFNFILKICDNILEIKEKQGQMVNGAFHDSYELSDNNLTNEISQLQMVLSQFEGRHESYISYAKSYQIIIEDVRGNIETIFGVNSKNFIG